MTTQDILSSTKRTKENLRAFRQRFIKCRLVFQMMFSEAPTQEIGLSEKFLVSSYVFYSMSIRFEPQLNNLLLLTIPKSLIPFFNF
jgi:hypothetical protein